MRPLRSSIWSHDSNETASRKPGALQAFDLQSDRYAVPKHLVILYKKNAHVKAIPRHRKTMGRATSPSLRLLIVIRDPVCRLTARYVKS